MTAEFAVVNWRPARAAAKVMATIDSWLFKGARMIEAAARVLTPSNNGHLRGRWAAALNRKLHVAWVGLKAPQGSEMQNIGAYVEGVIPGSGGFFDAESEIMPALSAPVERPGARKRYFCPFKTKTGVDTGLFLWAQRHGMIADRVRGGAKMTRKTYLKAQSELPGGLLVWGYKVRMLGKACDSQTPYISAMLQGMKLESDESERTPIGVTPAFTGIRGEIGGGSGIGAEEN